MKQRLMRYLAALEAAEKRSDGLIAALEAEARQDEANLEKIRRNVYGIFISLAQADWAQAQKEQAPLAAFQQLHTQRFECFPEPWRQRQAKAQAHGDVVTQTIEETKLKTVAQLWQLFEETEAET